jgi:hypothetical protein
VADGSNPSTPTTHSSGTNLPPLLPPFLVDNNAFWHHFGITLCNVSDNDFLQALRISKTYLKITDRTLSPILGISQSQLCRTLNGKRPFSLSFRTHIEAIFIQKVRVGNFPTSFFAFISMGNKCDENDLGEKIEEFLTARQVEEKTAKTLAFYRDNLRRILWYFTTNNLPMNIKEITPAHIRALLVYVQTNKTRWGGKSNTSPNWGTFSDTEFNKGWTEITKTVKRKIV